MHLARSASLARAVPLQHAGGTHDSDLDTGVLGGGHARRTADDDSTGGTRPYLWNAEGRVPRPCTRCGMGEERERDTDGLWELSDGQTGRRADGRGSPMRRVSYLPFLLLVAIMPTARAQDTVRVIDRIADRADREAARELARRAVRVFNEAQVRLIGPTTIYRRDLFSGDVGALDGPLVVDGEIR